MAKLKIVLFRNKKEGEKQPVLKGFIEDKESKERLYDVAIWAEKDKNDKPYYSGVCETPQAKIEEPQGKDDEDSLPF